MNEDPTGRRNLAFGQTPEAAGRVFGELFDDLMLVSYADSSVTADLSSADSVALAEGSGMDELLDSLLSSAHPPELLVEVPRSAERRAALASVIAARPATGIARVARTSGSSMVVLGPSSSASISSEGVALLLEAAALSDPPKDRPAENLWPAVGEPARTDGRIPAAVAPRPKPVRSDSPARRLPGRRALAGLAALGAAAAVLVLVLIGTSDLGGDGVIVALLLGVVLLQGMVVAGVAHLVSGLRAERRVQKRFRTRMMRRTERLLKRRHVARSDHEYVVELGRQLNRKFADARRASDSSHLNTYRQTQALLNLRDLVEVRGGLPPAGGWSASPDLLVYCVDLILHRKPSLVVECGSGLSTLVLALAADQHGLDTRIVSLEHQAEYAAATRALLDRHGVSHRVEIRVAPLEGTSIPDHETPWYAEAALVGLDDIGVLLVDGPPTATGSRARLPAVPLLVGHFAKQCTIVMDDLNRDSDRETAEAWSRLLPDFSFIVKRDYEKHLGLLQRD